MNTKYWNFLILCAPDGSIRYKYAIYWEANQESWYGAIALHQVPVQLCGESVG
jgi:hypothetical protein